MAKTAGEDKTVGWSPVIWILPCNDFCTCTAVAGGDRDIDLYHWTTPRFSSVWQDTLSVLVARGRARVSVSASAANWPKRIRDMQYVDHDDFAAAH
eukprot:COSAG06_NODE_730_length_12734_cov_8.227859_4_plen_96_part_00